MNFLLNIEDVSTTNIYFSNAKHNMIMDGNFTKLIYSTEYCTTNGLCIDLGLVPTEIHKMNSYYNDIRSNNKYIMYFDMNLENRTMIQQMMKIEQDVLTYYMEYCGITLKRADYILKTQLMNQNVKFYSHVRNVSHDNSFRGDGEDTVNAGNFYLKISGIWENETNLGITYKVVEYC